MPAPSPVSRVRVLPVTVSVDEPDSAKMLCTSSLYKINRVRPH
ncbi:MAG: hypothetical protein SD837_08030 [Candidatus Electrothrix scaldis]|nr:MAG: hypothetical protein SD837_08030 [Candidatus Electrothrix sp. GW3-3]